MTGCSSPAAPPQGDRGGTLKVLSVADIDHLDPALAAYVPTSTVMRAITRQLISYASVEGAERIVPQPDLAAELPTVSEDGLTYTFAIREGVNWDAPDGPRQIVADDFARGFKRLCNPLQSSAALSYFRDAIAGMGAFCTAFAEVDPTVEPMKQFIESTPLEGVRVVDDATLEITLNQPASDFIYMLTLDSATPAPIEVLDYLPDSPEYRDNFISSGPYTVASYVPDKSLVLKRNPAWERKTDALRAANVDGVDVKMGYSEDAIFQQLQAGTADVALDASPSPTLIQQLKATSGDRLGFVDSGAQNPFLVINTKSPNNGGALADIRVRTALQYAVDKAAVVQTLGGEDVAAVSNGVFGPGVLGHHDFNLYPTKDGKGDPKKAKQLLAQAGFPDGIALKMPFRAKGQDPDVAQTVQASLLEAGIRLELAPVNPTDYYSKYLTNKEATAAGVWDIAPAAWNPDWQGGAARSVFQPQFTYNGTSQTYNYTDYNNDSANELAQRALTTDDQGEVAELWGQVDELIMKDAVIVPIATKVAVNFYGKRVENYVPWTLSNQGDWTHLSLKQ